MNRIFPDEEDYDDYHQIEYMLLDILESRNDLWEYWAKVSAPVFLDAFSYEDEDEDDA